MNEERDTPDDLYLFAEMLVKQLQKQHQLRWNKHKVEDAAHDLFPVGWQVWRDEQNVGSGKNRMRDRAKNLLRDDDAERKHEPRTVGSDTPQWSFRNLLLSGSEPNEVDERSRYVADRDLTKSLGLDARSQRA